MKLLTTLLSARHPNRRLNVIAGVLALRDPLKKDQGEGDLYGRWHSPLAPVVDSLHATPLEVVAEQLRHGSRPTEV
ncbi:MAG TPA: hypothetical protein VJQ82_09885 [Terriglobales bacterium]|nr:hypothetical protein [Terriglobales bacterium]